MVLKSINHQLLPSELLITQMKDVFTPEKITWNPLKGHLEEPGIE